MRLDKFLKVSRLIKRRTVANEVSDKGKVFVNKVAAKPSKVLKVGDIITIEKGKNPITVRVLLIPDGNVSVQEAPTLYEVLQEENYWFNNSFLTSLRFILLVAVLGNGLSTTIIFFGRL